MECPGITARFRVDSGTNQFKAGKYVVGIGIIYNAVEAGFYSDVVECLPLDPAAQIRFPPRAVGIFLHPVTRIWPLLGLCVQCLRLILAAHDLTS